MKKGAKVRVYPIDSPDSAATGVVLLISSNLRSIAVAFEHLPPFAFQHGPFAIADCGPVLLAMQVEAGIWADVTGLGYYNIEEVSRKEPS